MSPKHFPKRSGGQISPKKMKRAIAAMSLSKNKRNRSAIFPALLVVLTYVATIVLSVLVAAGCVSTTVNVNDLYLAELSTNATYNVTLRVGYFGGCVSVPNGAANSASHGSLSHCVANMRNEDLDDLSEELWEDLKLSTNALNAVKDSLNATLPLARHLQTDIFLWEPIALHPVFFFISSIMLFVALMSSSYKRRYKAVLYIASVFSAFALAFAFVIAIGSLEALNAIFDGNKSSSQKALGDGITIRRGKNLDYCQSGLVAATALFYVVLGFLFVRRRPENFQKA